MRSKIKCSACPAFHTALRVLPRSSSTSEPSDPPFAVVLVFENLSKKIQSTDLHNLMGTETSYVGITPSDNN
jgi:hypothetical protein